MIRALALAFLLGQEPPTGSIRAGNEALAAGDLARAAGEYEAAVDRDPTSAIALHNLGLVRLLEDRPQEAGDFLERARAAGEGGARARAIYHLGHALFAASRAAEAQPDDLDRAIDLARASRDAFLDVLEVASDEDARANAEIAARRLQALIDRKEEAEAPSPESRPSSRPSDEGGESPESRPAPESRPSPGEGEGPREPATRPSEPESRPAEPETRPAQPESRPAPPESRPVRPESRPAGAESRPVEPRPPLSPEEMQQILDRLEDLQKAREAFEASLRRRERVKVERDW